MDLGVSREVKNVLNGCETNGFLRKIMSFELFSYNEMLCNLYTDCCPALYRVLGSIQNTTTNELLLLILRRKDSVLCLLLSLWGTGRHIIRICSGATTLTGQCRNYFITNKRTSERPHSDEVAYAIHMRDNSRRIRGTACK